MLLNFDRIDVVINGSGIVATNATLSTNNSIEPSYIVGYTRPINQLPSGPTKTVFNASYLPITSQEPTYAIVNKIKSMINDTGYYGEKIELAGIVSENFFLDNYNLRIQPNNIVDASVSYSTYWELCGNIKEKSNRIDYLHYGDINHAWSTYILSSGDYINTPVYDFSYNFNASWKPIYTIGRKFPIEMKLLDISESIAFSIDSYREILFTGEAVYENLFNTNNGNLEFKNISLLCQDNCEDDGGVSDSLALNISGFQIKSININAQVGEMVRVNYTAIRNK